MRILATTFLTSLLLTTATWAEPPADLNDPPPDAERHPSGLISKVLVEGEGTLHPDDNDMVATRFIGWTPDGVEFENMYTNNQMRVFDLTTVFPGWREGLKLMVKGEKRRLWIPGHLAPQSPAKGPSGPVIFDVELLGIKPVPNAPPSFDPPADAERTPSGAHTVRVSEGTGDVNPEPTEAALLEYTLWTKDGETFDSTAQRGRPTLFLLDQVMAPFSEAVQKMVVGEVRRIWIPADLARGQWPGSPQGPLLFEVKLLNISPPDILEKAQPAAPGS